MKYIQGSHNIEDCNDEIAAMFGVVGFKMFPMLNRLVFYLRSFTCPEGVRRHNDPFDWILISRAKAEGMTFLTYDKLIPDHGEAKSV